MLQPAILHVCATVPHRSPGLTPGTTTYLVDFWRSQTQSAAMPVGKRSSAVALHSTRVEQFAELFLGDFSVSEQSVPEVLQRFLWPFDASFRI